MKKLSAIILSLMMVLSLAACGSGTDTPATDAPTATQEPAQTGEPTSEPTNAAEPGDTKEVTVKVDGKDETLTLTRYKGQGWYIYYDAANMTEANLTEEGVSKTFAAVTNTGDVGDVYINVVLEENMTAAERADQVANDCIGSPEDVTFGGGTATYVNTVNVDADTMCAYYFMDTDAGCLAVELHYGRSVAESWGSKLEAMAATFGLDA